MTIDIKQLESLLERVTPGPWEVAYLDENGQAVVQAAHTEVATCRHHYVGSIEKQMHANAHLIAAAPDLARRVIAAEKLVEALALARDESLSEDGTGWLLDTIDDILTEWENMK